jgi:hypothetical protein
VLVKSSDLVVVCTKYDRLLHKNQLIPHTYMYLSSSLLVVLICAHNVHVNTKFVCIHLYVVEDIESALSECEQLVQTGRLSSQFPSTYSTVEFYNALYSPTLAPASPHHRYPYHHTQHDHCPPFPRLAPAVIEEQCVTEEMPQSADGELFF